MKGEVSLGITSLETTAEGVKVNANNPKGLGKKHEKLLGARIKNNKNVWKAASN